MNAAAIAIVVLYCISTAVHLVHHGQRRTDYSAPVALLNLAVMGFLFYQAGLFK